jgi:predicted transcriptional regulator
MQLNLTPGKEAQLAQIASKAGTDPEHLVMDAALRLLEDDQFRAAVIEGEEALQRGEYLTHEQVGQRLEKFLRT